MYKDNQKNGLRIEFSQKTTRQSLLPTRFCTKHLPFNYNDIAIKQKASRLCNSLFVDIKFTKIIQRTFLLLQ